jgi:hypothetical protein
MEDTRLPKMVFNAKPEDRRGVGRPRLRWLDGVKAGIKTLSLEIWRIKTQDRTDSKRDAPATLPLSIRGWFDSSAVEKKQCPY